MSADPTSTPIVHLPNLIFEILVNHHPKFWMFQIPRLHDLFDRSLSRPPVETRPIHTLMRTGKITQRDLLRSAPPHRHRRSVSMTHDALAQHVDAVLVVIAIVFSLLVREAGKVVGRVHVAMETFLMVRISGLMFCFGGIRILELSLTRQWSSW